MHTQISAATLQAWLQDDDELALLDVREAGQFGEGHLFFAVPIPYSRLEADVLALVPRTEVRIVLVDDGDGLSLRAARRLHTLGYVRVSILENGIRGWQSAGFTLFKGVNVPSKTFGELIEHARGTPHLSAEELAAWQAAGKRFVLLDGRTVEEHAKMTIPGAVCCPNGELAYRISVLTVDPAIPIVVHCAGRTRSIIGAQTLRELGIPNPVFALENGTQGWHLAGYRLEHGSGRRYPDDRPSGLSEARQAARALASRHEVALLSPTQAQQWLDDPTRTTYVFDIRTAQEFGRGSLAGALHAPGGQLVQATDQYVGVRKSRLILLDEDGVRAPVVASWIRQLGFEAAVLEEGIHAPLRIAVPSLQPPPSLPRIGSGTLRELRASAKPYLLIDLRPSAAYRAAHAEGAIWSIRPLLVQTVSRLVPVSAHIVLVSDTPLAAELAAIDLREAGYANVLLCGTGLQTCIDAGHALISSPTDPADAMRIDYLFFVHDRHEGNREAAKQYLAWETGLLAQCSSHELSAFRLG